MKTSYKKRNAGTLMYISILFGVLAGSLLFLYYVLRGSSIIGNEFFQYPMTNIASFGGSQMITLILKRRIPQFVFLLVVLNIFSYPVVLSGCSMIFGGYYGYVMSQLFYQFGNMGIPYGIICFFPHYICYGISLILVGKWFYNVSNQYYSGNVDVKNTQYFFKFFVIILLLFLGVFWEIKFQKNILNFFYQHLV
ncbi:MAG: hypothetical protein K2L07_04455 [Lachnospiraceae bacterium]|nr:hypothetical protein [Lachnospiraceae bacterium]